MFLIFTEDDGWHTNQLIKAFESNNKKVVTAKINESSIIVDDKPRIIFEGKEIFLKNIDGAFVRGIPGGTLEEVCFHLDILHFLELHKINVYNNTVCIEKSVDKVRTSCILNAHKIPTPKTFITSNVKDLKKLSNAINYWKINPTGTEGYRTAEVTLGGVDTNELSSKTMMSKKNPGLYFIGEVVDVTGHLGGYNFQWAWSSGYVAGQYA